MAEILVAAGAVLLLSELLSSKPSKEPDVDLVPPEFQRRKATDALSVTPTALMRLQAQALHTEFFSDFRPYSVSCFIRPEDPSAPVGIKDVTITDIAGRSNCHLSCLLNADFL